MEYLNDEIYDTLKLRISQRKMKSVKMKIFPLEIWKNYK